MAMVRSGSCDDGKDEMALEGRIPRARVSAVACSNLRMRVPQGRLLMNRNQNGSGKGVKGDQQ